MNITLDKADSAQTGLTIRQKIGESLKCVHVCNGLDPVRDGGMVPSILGMTSAVASRVGELTIVTPTPSRRDRIEVPRRVRLEGPEVDLTERIRTASVVHIHGLWQAHTRRASLESMRNHIPYLIAAHGMAEPWALKHKRWKKLIYLNLVEKRNLRGSSCLHALTRPEVDQLRALAPRTPVALVPNGVDLSRYAGLPGRSELELEFPELVGKFVVLFLGRLHAKKGLDMLAEAIPRLAPAHPELHLVLAGPDDGALGPFLNQLRLGGQSGRVTYLGHVSGRRSLQAWGAADAFILPSYSEGFSMAVLEALACELPVLITTTCHFPELAAAGGGIVVEPNVDSVVSGLRVLLEMSNQDRANLAHRGRDLVARDYTWERQGERLARVYEWLAGGGPEPEAVVIQRGAEK